MDEPKYRVGETCRTEFIVGSVVSIVSGADKGWDFKGWWYSVMPDPKKCSRRLPLKEHYVKESETTRA